MKKLILLSISCWLIPSLQGQNYTDTLDIKIEEFNAKPALSGFAVAIVNKNGIVYENSSGFADIEAQVPYTQNTLQCLASVSKTTIALAVMKLQDQGLLTLESAINDFLPYEVNHPLYPDSIIRVRHLVTHTSGIIDTENNYDLRNRYFTIETNFTESKMGADDLEWFDQLKDNEKLSLNKYCKNVFAQEGEWYDKTTFHEAAFGQKYVYSNLGAVLMAYIVELASETDFKTYIQQHIFDVLNMKNSTFDASDIDQHLFAKSYVTETLIASPFLGDNTFPDGGMHSSCRELGTFLTEMIRGFEGNSELLSAPAYHQMFTPLLPPSIASTSEEGKNFENIGVFWHISPTGQWYHNGGNPLGGTVYMWFDPTTKTGRIMMTNCDVRGSREMIVEFLSIWRTMEKYALLLSDVE
jgi:CubicO group peptidase (beta-lactamase class C family)